MDQGRADVVQPTERFERDVAGVADQNEAVELASRAVIVASASVAAEAVIDDEVSVVEVDFDAERAGKLRSEI